MPTGAYSTPAAGTELLAAAPTLERSLGMMVLKEPPMILKREMPSAASMRMSSCLYLRFQALGSNTTAVLWPLFHALAARAACPAMAEARPTPITPLAGPMTGLAEDIRRAMPSPCTAASPTV